jgi:hypothetical protein
VTSGAFCTLEAFGMNCVLMMYGINSAVW